jgi:hypothetical protein
LIEYQFGRNARIGTAQDHGEGVLRALQLYAPGQCLVGVLLLILRITSIPVPELGKSLIGGYWAVGLLTPSGDTGHNQEQAQAMIPHSCS